MSVLKKLASQTALYGLSSIVGRMLNYLLVPFYTSVFHPEDFGVVTEMYAYVAFLNIIFTYGMETAYFRFATKEKHRLATANGFITGTGGNDNALEIYRLSETTLLITSFVFAAILMGASSGIADVLGYTAHQNYIIWLALILATDAIVAIPFSRLRLEGKAAFFAFAKLSNIVLNVFFNVFYLVICPLIATKPEYQDLRPIIRDIYNPDMGVGYVFLSNLLANIFTVILLFPTYRSFRFRFDLEKLKPMLTYAIPILFMGITGMINEVLDRVLLKVWLPEGFYSGQSNLAAVGVYGACYKLSMFMTIAIQAFRYAADPFFFSKAEDDSSPLLFAKVMKWFVLVCLLIFLSVTLNLDILQYILRKEEFREGIMIVPVLLVANLFLGVYYNLSFWFKLTDRTIYGTYISVGGALLTIALNWILIPILGYMGCAITTLICYFSMAVVNYILGQKYYPIPYPVVKLSGYITFACFLAYIGISYQSPDNISTSFIIHTFLIVVFLITIFIFEKVIRRR
jgi:O-antigen/teichoic acid export membrane protein